MKKDECSISYSLDKNNKTIQIIFRYRLDTSKNVIFTADVNKFKEILYAPKYGTGVEDDFIDLLERAVQEAEETFGE